MHKLSGALITLFPALLASCSCTREKREEPVAPTITQSVIKEIVNVEELDNNVLAVIKFYSKTCPACQMSVEPYELLAQKNSAITFYAVDIDKEGTLKDAHTIRAIPTFIVFDHGNNIGSVVGFNEEQLIQLLNKLTGGEQAVQSAITEIVSPEEFAEKISANKVVVKFFSHECGFCKMIAPVYENLAKEHGAAIAFFAVDVDVQSELANQYASTGVPVFYAFSAGKQVDKVLGARADELERVVKELAQAQQSGQPADDSGNSGTPED